MKRLYCEVLFTVKRVGDAISNNEQMIGIAALSRYSNGLKRQLSENKIIVMDIT